MPSGAQLKKVWASARELGLEEQELRDLVEDLTGRRSIGSLTFAQARDLIDALVRMGASRGPGTRKPSGRRAAANETKLISGDVRDYIARLRAQLGDRWLQDNYFAGACRRVIKRDRPRTAAEGARVVEMLKKRVAYEEGRGQR